MRELTEEQIKELEASVSRLEFENKKLIGAHAKERKLLEDTVSSLLNKVEALEKENAHLRLASTCASREFELLSERLTDLVDFVYEHGSKALRKKMLQRVRESEKQEDLLQNYMCQVINQAYDRKEREGK